MHLPYLVLGENEGFLENLLELGVSGENVEGELRRFSQFVRDRRKLTGILLKHLALNRVSGKRLGACLKMLNCIIGPASNEEFQEYFYFSGEGSEIFFEGEQTYPFVQGFSCCMWVRLEKDYASEFSRLFQFVSKNQSGIECYFIRNQLFYRTFEDLDLNYAGGGVLLGELSPNEWVFVGMEHTRSKFVKSCFNATINGNYVVNVHLNYPKIKGPSKLTSSRICENVNGQLGFAVFFSGGVPLGKLNRFYLSYNAKANGIESISSLYSLFDHKLMEKVVSLYHPFRAENKQVFDDFGRSSGTLIGRSGVARAPYEDCFYGGVLALLPILEQIKLIEENQEILLEQWLQLLKLSLTKDLTILKVLPAALSSGLESAIRPFHVFSFREISSNLEKTQEITLVTEVLWKFELWANYSGELEVLKLLSSLYSENPVGLTSKFGVKEIVDVMLLYYGSTEESLGGCVLEFHSVLTAIFTRNPETICSDIRVLIDSLCNETSHEVRKRTLLLIETLLSDTATPYSSTFARHFIESGGVEVYLKLLQSTLSTELRVLCLISLERAILKSVRSPLFASRKEILHYICITMLPSYRALSEDPSIPRSSLSSELIRSFSSEFSNSCDDSRLSEDSDIMESPLEPSGTEEVEIYLVALHSLLDRALDQGIIDSSEIFKNRSGVKLFQETVQQASLYIKHRAMQDLLMLTNSNKVNSVFLNKTELWHH